MNGVEQNIAEISHLRGLREIYKYWYDEERNRLTTLRNKDNRRRRRIKERGKQPVQNEKKRTTGRLKRKVRGKTMK